MHLELSRLLPCAALLLVIGVSCKGGGEKTPAGEQTASADTAPPAPDSATRPVAWTVTDTAAGPIRPGMTLGEAAAALGAALPDTTRLERACDYVRFPGTPPGMAFIAVEGWIARIDVDTLGVLTDRGVGVGHTEAQVQSAYAGRVTVEPHKYDGDGHYLVIRTEYGPDSEGRLIFETNGTRVTRYRIGLLPAVAWVEACS